MALRGKGCVLSPPRPFWRILVAPTKKGFVLDPGSQLACYSTQYCERDLRKWERQAKRIFTLNSILFTAHYEPSVNNWSLTATGGGDGCSERVEAWAGNLGNQVTWVQFKLKSIADPTQRVTQKVGSNFRTTSSWRHQLGFPICDEISQIVRDDPSAKRDTWPVSFEGLTQWVLRDLVNPDLIFQYFFIFYFFYILNEFS